MKITWGILTLCSLSMMSAVKLEEILCKASPGCKLARCDPGIPSLRLNTNEYPLTCIKTLLPDNAAKAECEQLKREFQSLKSELDQMKLAFAQLKRMGEAMRDPCRWCGANLMCRDRRCVCRNGFIRKNDRCVEDKCRRNSDCGENEDCENGDCVCDRELRRYNGRCVRVMVDRACENTVLNISCPSGQMIHIFDALYGRTEENECPYTGPKITNCRAAGSDRIVSQKCDGKSRCHVPANNRVFREPCRGTIKYLEVEYICVY